MATTCDHPAFFSSLCVACGMPQSMIQTTLETKFTSKVVGKGNIMEYNSKVIQSKGVENLHELRKMKKLILVLDIDLTLIHSVQIDGATPKDTVQDYGNIHHLPIEEMAGNGLKHLVMKKRPFLDKFLEEAAKLFRIHIYTAGTRRYAEAVVKVLDPKGVIIGNRIVSRTEGAALSRPDALTKSLNNIFFDEASMAVILDDREDVWKGLQNEQLLLVRPYHFFYPGEKSSLSVGAQEGCLAEVNVLPTTGNNITTAGPENKPISGSKGVISPIIGLHGQVGQIRGYASSTTPEFTEGDDQLLRCLDVLHDIHRTYFREMNGDIRALQPHAGKTINQMKKKVLEGCTITFSGLIPVNELHPQNHFLWKLAISLGAQVSSDVTPRTTHLLSIQKDTKKVVECLKHRPHNVWILHPDWLVYCRWSLAKAEETTFMLVPLQPGQSRPDPVMDTSPLEVTDTTTSSSSSSASSSQDPKLRAVSTAVQSSAKKRKLSETESTASMTVTSNVGSSKEGKQSQDGGNDNKRIRTTLINLVSTEEAEEDEEDVVVIPDTKRDRSGSLDEEARFAGDAYIRDIEYQDVDNEDAGRDDDFVYGHEADADDDDNNQEDEDDDCAGDCRLYYEKHIVALDGDEVDAEDVSSSLRYERRYHEPIDSASDSDGAEANVPAKKSPYSDDDEDDDFGSFESLLQTRMTSSTAYASASEEEDH